MTTWRLRVLVRDIPSSRLLRLSPSAEGNPEN